jgi:hypothetical protein
MDYVIIKTWGFTHKQTNNLELNMNKTRRYIRRTTMKRTLQRELYARFLFKEVVRGIRMTTEEIDSLAYDAHFLESLELFYDDGLLLDMKKG